MNTSRTARATAFVFAALLTFATLAGVDRLAEREADAGLWAAASIGAPRA